MTKHTIFDIRWKYRCKNCGHERIIYSPAYSIKALLNRYVRRFHWELSTINKDNSPS